ncbi:MAG: hypothetical protein KDA42_02240 [Planctomycetales bacterium]|nr:hypothetical protein [Planctomycetales bacterium]
MKRFAARCLLLSCLLLVANACHAEKPLRLVSFNAEILTAPGSRASRLTRFRWDTAREAHFERVASVVESLEPDILNLVEATSVEAVDHLIEILHEKGLNEYRGYHVESNDNYTGMDVALITRLTPDTLDGQIIRTIYSESDDPTWRETFHYNDYDGKPRSRSTSLERNSLYFFTVSGWKLGFLGLHLKSNPEDDYSNAKRMAEANLARRVVRSEVVPQGYLPIIWGDLNDYDPDVPDRDPTRDAATTVLRDLKDFDSERTGVELVNVAQLIQRESDRYTSHWDRNENGADDSDDVKTMLDHILLPRELMPFVRRAWISHVTDLKTSDHWPVVVDLMLPEQGGTKPQ